MTGPEHYLEAERLLEGARESSQQMIAAAADEQEISHVVTSTGAAMANLLAAAQVHATLALGAAVALQVTATKPPHITEAGKDWRGVLKPVVDEEAAS